MIEKYYFIEPFKNKNRETDINAALYFSPRILPTSETTYKHYSGQNTPYSTQMDNKQRHINQTSYF